MHRGTGLTCVSPLGSIITTCAVPGTLALTYDDGPYIYTSQLLDILEAQNVTATFFVAGNNKGKKGMDNANTAWPAIMRRMHAAGHQIASHTWTHRNLNLVNSTIQRTEIIYNEMSFRNLFGWIPTYMRPPYLECNAASGCQNMLRTLGYHIINVNIDTKDYMYDTPETIQTAKDRFSGGISTNAAANSYIELSHDVHYQTVVNLTQFMIDTAKARGYRLVSVGECLNDPKENWYRPAGGAISASYYEDDGDDLRAVVQYTNRLVDPDPGPVKHSSHQQRDSGIFYLVQCPCIYGEGITGPDLRWNQWLHMPELEVWQLLLTLWILRLKPHVLRNGMPIGLRVLRAAGFGRE
ncbi:polysaccharide deacetylase [Colletotrichum higginsianum]|nr:polysaccharide deacetylase [Colletotrichum higginsianum]